MPAQGQRRQSSRGGEDSEEEYQREGGLPVHLDWQQDCHVFRHQYLPQAARAHVLRAPENGGEEFGGCCICVHGVARWAMLFVALSRARLQARPQGPKSMPPGFSSPQKHIGLYTQRVAEHTAGTRVGNSTALNGHCFLYIRFDCTRFVACVFGARLEAARRSEGSGLRIP